MKEKIVSIIKSPILYILAIVILVQVNIYKTAPDYLVKPDTCTYYEEYDGGNILKGEFDYFRTPGYPYFIKFIKLFSSDDNSLYNNIVTAQKILFIVAVILVFLSMMKITKNKIISSIVTILVGILPNLVLFNTVILTEALGVFQIVLLMYLVICYIYKPRKLTAIITSLQILIMIMTRPGFIYLIPIYMVFIIFRYLMNKKELKEAIVAFISIIICSILVLGYCIRIKQLYGSFMISSVTYLNDLVLIADSKTFTETSNENLKNVMQEIKGDSDDEALSWDAARAITNIHIFNNNPEIKQFVKEAKFNAKYLRYIANKIYNTGFLTIGTLNDLTTDSDVIKMLQLFMMPINFALVAILIFVIAIYLIYKLFKDCKVDWILAVFFVLIFANYFTLMIGAPFEQQRLFITSIIPLVMCIGYIISRINIKNDENQVDKENNLFYKLVIEETNNTLIQFIRYLFVGGIAAVVNIGGLYIFNTVFNIHYLVANVISFILGLVVNYLLSKKFVFSKETSFSKILEFSIYTIIGVIGLALDTLFMWIFTDKIQLYFMISKIISTVLVFVWNFLGRKLIYVIIEKKSIKKE